MNKKAKIILIICIVILLGSVAGIIIWKKFGSNNIDDTYVEDYWEWDIYGIDAPKRISGEKKYKNLRLSNFEIEHVNDLQCEVRATVTNETNKLIEMQNIKLELYDANGNLLETLGAQIDSVEPGGYTQVFAMLRRRDISEIVRIEIQENIVD